MIRLAVPADAEALSALHRASFEDGWSADDFATWLSRKEGFAAIAAGASAGTSEREAVAFGLALAAGDDAELLTIAVSPGERRLGIGKQIFGAIDAEARRRGLHRWVLEVAHDNVAALALYNSAGFMEIGSRKAYYQRQDGRADAVVMVRAVGVAGGHERF